MTRPTTLTALVVSVCLAQVLRPGSAAAQYAETPRVLAADDWAESAVQIGGRLFVAGVLTDFSPPTDGAVRRVGIAHGRVYRLGEFTEINGSRRLGLAALDAATGRLSPRGRAFDPVSGVGLGAVSLSGASYFVT